MRLALFFAILSTLMPVAAGARCIYIPPKFAEISVEECAAIDGEPSLLVTGRLVAYIDLETASGEPYSITSIDASELGPAERYVWTQVSEPRRDCEFITSQDPLLVTLSQPCCDVEHYEIQPDGSMVRTGRLSCVERLQEISDIDMKDMEGFSDR